MVDQRAGRAARPSDTTAIQAMRSKSAVAILDREGMVLRLVADRAAARAFLLGGRT